MKITPEFKPSDGLYISLYPKKRRPFSASIFHTFEEDSKNPPDETWKMPINFTEVLKMVEKFESIKKKRYNIFIWNCATMVKTVAEVGLLDEEPKSCFGHQLFPERPGQVYKWFQQFMEKCY